ncbi:hypothetical protein [Arenibacter sp. S6351L]|uniref:hypothetical protein n=2 Tax=Arenibacter TaxID=178469 RepID=UPI001FF161EA|nr:hypothetical protein [Arenibacter sp. S6351L]MCK0135586.1 hypothetical protein [Arenibacter sp. S6351L]
MKSTKSITRFDKSGYYFIGLIALVILGFWPSYFSEFFNGTGDFTFYFHFHTILMSLWMLTLILQPILIRRRKLTIHKWIGKGSYILFPLMFISILLLMHSRNKLNNENLDMALFVPFKDLIILGTAYLIAITYRKNMEIHARAMIATGIVFIEPALVRFINYAIIPLPEAYAVAMFILYSLIIILIIKERKQKKGRWVFPLILGLYIIVHSIIVFNIHLTTWESISKWFIALPLT